ncbi:MAG: helix-hairpin-helix domain-containing protein [Candidatus Woesebacteria bacterium]|nr:helix-hairpin-helix domain-containing protein [Candidatus Woesebacteria bacterium]
MDKIKILVDDREEMNSLIAKRQEALEENFEIEKNHLEVGDIVYPEKSLVIEVKDVGDFYGSVKGGRIFEQALNMKNNYANCFIMIVGNWEKLLKSMKRFNNQDAGIVLHICFGAEMSLSVKYGVHVIRCDTPSEFSYKLKSLCEKLGECPSPKDVVKLNFSFEQRYVSIFTAIAGIGKTKAKQIAKKYPNLKSLLTATEEDLKDIDGIGPKLANEIMRFVNGT